MIQSSNGKNCFKNQLIALSNSCLTCHISSIYFKNILKVPAVLLWLTPYVTDPTTQKETDHAKNYLSITLAFCTFASSEPALYFAEERFAALLWVDEYPHINIVSVQVEGEQFSCHLQLIWFSPKRSRHKALRLKSVFIYIYWKNIHAHFTLSSLHSFKQNTFHCNYCILFCESIACKVILYQVTEANWDKGQVSYEQKRKTA